MAVRAGVAGAISAAWSAAAAFGWGPLLSMPASAAFRFLDGMGLDATYYVNVGPLSFIDFLSTRASVFSKRVSKVP